MAVNNHRLLLIAEPSSYRIAAYLEAALKMNLEVLIASRGQHSLIAEVHEGLHIDLINHESSLATILHQAQLTPFIGVIGIDDSTVELAAKAARKMGLSHNNPTALQFTRRKDLARACLANACCPVPLHWLINLDALPDSQLAKIDFPCVVKPLTLSASRGVIRVDTKEQLVNACKRIEPMLKDIPDPFEKRHLLVEKYIDGIEVAFEGYLYHGKLITLVIFDKPDPLTGPYFEETIYVTPSKLSMEMQSRIKVIIAQACKAYGLTTGPIHAELRIHNNEPWILEVAARTIGGDCARILDTGSEFNLEELVISLAIDEIYKVKTPEDARGVMMIPIKERGILHRVEGLPDARRVDNIIDIDIIVRRGNELIPLPEGNQYPGYIFARAETSDEVVAALRKSHDKLNFVVTPIFKTEVAG